MKIYFYFIFNMTVEIRYKAKLEKFAGKWDLWKISLIEPSNNPDEKEMEIKSYNNVISKIKHRIEARKHRLISCSKFSVEYIVYHDDTDTLTPDSVTKMVEEDSFLNINIYSSSERI